MNLLSKFNARMEARKSGERGLALLDVLLGMAIFALIVVIGVQNFSTLRNRAYVTQVSSDAKQVAVGIAAEGTAPNASFGYTVGEITVEGVNLTGDNDAHLVSGTTFDDFVICVDRDGAAPSATYTADTSATSIDTSAPCA